MTVADLRYFGALVSVVLFSSVVLLRQFLDGDLTERKHTGRTRRLVTPVLRQPAWPLGPRRGALDTGVFPAPYSFSWKPAVALPLTGDCRQESRLVCRERPTRM
jgi:hypothetical protein